MLTSFEVIHQGVPKKMVEWLKGHRTGNAAVRDLLELTGSVCLAASFEDRYPEYPTFTVKLTASNLKQPTEDVIRWLAGGVKNNLATAVLDGLELLDGDKLKPHQSRYAKVVLEKLDGKPPGQVVNRKELITVKNDVERESQYQLEPELLLIVLVSLVQNGNITLSVTGKKLDAANLSEASKTPLDQLLAFKHVEKPKGLPLAELVALFDLLGLAEGLIRNENTHDEAVKQLRAEGQRTDGEGRHGRPARPDRPAVLGQRTDPRRGPGAAAAEARRPEGLPRRTASVQHAGQAEELLQERHWRSRCRRAHLDLIKQIEDLNGLVQELTPLTGYLATAAAVLPPQDPWRTQMETVRSEWRAKLMDPSCPQRRRLPPEDQPGASEGEGRLRDGLLQPAQEGPARRQRGRQEEGTAQRPTARKPEEAGRRVAPAALQPDRASDPAGESSAVLHAGQGRPGRLAHLPALQLPAAGGEPRRQRHGGPPADRPAA